MLNFVQCMFWSFLQKWNNWDCIKIFTCTLKNHKCTTQHHHQMSKHNFPQEVIVAHRVHLVVVVVRILVLGEHNHWIRISGVWTVGVCLHFHWTCTGSTDAHPAHDIRTSQSETCESNSESGRTFSRLERF